MAMESKQEFDLRKYVPKEEQRRTFAKVFDKGTIEAVHSLSTKGHFQVLEHVVSTGKEAHVFRAVDSAGNNKAVKIYKTSTSDFNNMYKYLHGDIRFKNVGRSKRDIVFAWTKKEYRNLTLMNKVGISCPMPIAFQKNVLVMEFIGGKDAAPKLRDTAPSDLEKAYETVVEMLARLLFKAELVYADFSEYNILNNEGNLVLIDAGQAVLTTHPEAENFFERDLRNVARYFSKQGMEKTAEQLREDIKAKKGKI
ncbi:MAG: serine protein kinase RIO [Candidatus Diapherotrites archaeon]|uniref:non-specific serine/threonine protein kinase n=1 Tax=Candidatus Iainarchaeum sp. TaxID=3101447 RepID=A0A939CA38_9ARCH|nr:serine protein kinase RIO [Candidatus Diapherotrites archaeon]